MTSSSAERRFREEEANFRSLVEQNIAGVVIVREDGTIGYCNGCFANMIGFAPAEVLGRGLLDFVPEAEHPIVVASLRSQLFESGAPVQIASTVHARNGSLVEVLVNASKSSFEGRPASVAVVVDVTARNRAQRELASTAAILAAEHESSPDGILVVDPAARIISFNRRFREMFDIPAELLASRDPSPALALAFRQVADPDAFLSRVRHLRDHPDESAHDELALTDGRVIDRLTSPFKALDGEYLGRIWYFRDITLRRTAEEALRATEERFRLLVEEAPDAILLYNSDQNRFIAANKAAERLFGVPRKEILERGATHFYTPGQPDGRTVARSFSVHTRRALAGEEVTYERRIRRPSGEERLCRATLVRLPSNVRLLRVSLVDITRQARARRELASTAAILAAEHESSPDGIVVVDPSGRIISHNRRFVEMFHVSAEALASREKSPALGLVMEQMIDPETFLRRVQHLYAHPEESGHDELLLKDGRAIDRRTSPFKISSGEYLGRIWFFRDITERRKAEESLRASEERFRQLVEDAPDAILLYDLDQDRLIAVNRAAERLFGASRAEILEQGPQGFFAPEQPDGRPAAETFFENARRALAGEEVTFERRIRRPSGEERMARSTLVRLPSDIRLVRASMVDITDLKNREREVQQKTALLEATLENMGEGISVFGPDLELLTRNQLARRILELPAAMLQRLVSFEDIMQLRAERGDFGEGDVKSQVEDRVARFRAQVPWSETRRRRDGRAFETRFHPTPEGGGVFIFRDVTEREQADARIREEEAKFRSLVEQDVAGIAIVRDDGTIGYCNGCFAKTIGYAPADVVGRPLLDFVPETERPVVIQSLRSQLFETGAPVQIVSAVRAGDGSLIEVLVNASRSMFEGRSAFIAVFIDVTAQNRTQRELAATAAILATEHDSSPDGILVIDTAGRIVSFNRRYTELFDIPQDLLAARDDEPVLALASQRVLNTAEFVRQVMYLRAHPELSAHDEVALKDGRVLDRFTSSFKAPSGEHLGRVWFFRDVTQRRKAEESLRASEERFRMLIEEAPDAILLFDADRDRLTAANKAAERLFGVPREEILDVGPQRFYAPEQPDGRPAIQSYSEHNKRALAGEQVTFERRVRRSSGEERVCHVTLVRLPSNVRLLRASMVDVTEQRTAEAQLSEVLRSTVSRQEAERQRIARELHDSLGQYLAAMSMKLEVLGQGLAEASPLKPGLADLKSLTSAVGKEMSRLAWELRPIVLDDLGLEPAIRRFVEEWAERSDLRFDLHLALKDRRLPPEVETTLYRVLQEGITNVVKHARAQNVGVILKASEDDVVMIIEDDGIGFEMEDLSRSSSPRLGLLGMRERLATIHGSLEIEAKSGKGTTLIIRVTR